jgi:hypothetical protein
MGFIEEMAKAKAYDQTMAQKQAADASKASQLDKLVEAKRAEQEAQRKALIDAQMREEGMAAALGRTLAPRSDINNTNTIMQPVTPVNGLADVLNRGR